VPITVVNQSVGTISYTIFGGSASGSGRGSGSGTHGSGVLASGTIRPSGTASASVSGQPTYTVVFGWPTFPSYQVSASGVVKIVTSAQT
jgi:hypothetical protein